MEERATGTNMTHISQWNSYSHRYRHTRNNQHFVKLKYILNAATPNKSNIPDKGETQALDTINSFSKCTSIPSTIMEFSTIISHI